MPETKRAKFTLGVEANSQPSDQEVSIGGVSARLEGDL